MPRLRYVRCDVFSARPLAGNPLAVFTDARGLDAGTMQALAREMNLSETVFVLPATDGGHAKIRIFTPQLELAFAGHPTIGAAFVLARPLQTDLLRIETGMGVIPTRVERAGANPFAAWLELPLPQEEPVADPESILAALGLPGAVTPIAQYRFGIAHVVVELGEAEQVARLTPDFAELAKLGPKGCVVFARQGPNLHSRVFAPGAGVNEDPATGSAVAPLALHVHRYGTNKTEEMLSIAQGVELGRPSELRAELLFTEGRLERIRVGGDCVLLGRGEWEIPGRVPGSGCARDSMR